MRPRLGEDVRYVPSPDGVYLHNAAGEATLRGKHSYEWLRRLAPYLTGDHELTELTEPLPATARQLVTDLVDMLHQQGFVTDARTDRPHTLTETERATYAAEIAFIRYTLDSAEYRFQRYRQAAVLLLGTGPLLSALVQATLAAGGKTVRAATATLEEAQALHDAGQQARRDTEQHLDIILRGVAGDLAEDDLAGVDVVWQIVTAGSEADLLRVARVADKAGVILGQILISGDHAWFGPVGHPAQTGAGSAWRRLAALRPAHPHDSHQAGGAGEDPPPPGPAGWLTGPVPMLIAGRACLAAFRALTGLDERTRPRGAPANVLTCLDLRTLDSRIHHFLPHPLARPVSDATGVEATKAAIEALVTGPALEARQLLDAASACVDPRTGLFGTLDEEDFTQVPLAVARATVSDPCGLLPAWAPPVTVVGCGPDQDQARVRTLCAAFATYGSLAVNGATVWGSDLLDGALRPVPARRAFPVLTGPRVPYQAPVGAAAGLSWAQAVSAGLRQHCEALLATRLGAAGQPFPLVPFAASVLTERGTELLELLQTARQRVSVYDLTTLLDMPAYACCVGATTVTLSCAATGVEAMTAGLERVLLAWQASTQGRTAYAPTVPLFLPERLRGSMSPRWQPVADRNLIDVLTTQTGCRPVAVPLTHDPEAARVLPYVVQVVLLNE